MLNFYYFIQLFGVGIGFSYFQKLSRSSKWLLLLLLLTFASELLADYFAHKLHNNLFVYHIFNPIQFTLILLSYNYELKKKWIYAIIPLAVIFSILNSFFFQHYKSNLNSNFLNIESVFFVLITLIFIKKLMESYKENDLFMEFPLFIISLGLLVFSIISILTFGMYNYFETIKDNENIYSFLNILRLLSNYIFYISFTLAFLSKQKQLS